MVVYCSIKATFISPILVQYRLTKYKTSPAKAYLASVVKSHEKVVDQCSSKSDNCLHGATHTHTRLSKKDGRSGFLAKEKQNSKVPHIQKLPDNFFLVEKYKNSYQLEM